MTSGERRFARRLESHLEDDYICWHDVPVGASHQHPDFLVLHPRRGLLVIEVKDWKLGNLRAIDKVSATLYVEGKEIRTANPFEQARQYAHRVTQLLQSDRALIAEPGSSYQGKLICPWGYGVVLANISRNAFTLTDLGQVIPPERVICQDEMVESVDAEAFQQRLWGMFGVTFRCLLSLPQVDRVRWHLFPEIRVSQGTFDLGSPSAPKVETVPDIVRVMDLQQEQLARSMGEGHRVIHGVAGSGKTMILGYRAQYLAQALASVEWPHEIHQNHRRRGSDGGRSLHPRPAHSRGHGGRDGCRRHDLARDPEGLPRPRGGRHSGGAAIRR